MMEQQNLVLQHLIHFRIIWYHINATSTIAKCPPSDGCLHALFSISCVQRVTIIQMTWIGV